LGKLLEAGEAAKAGGERRINKRGVVNPDLVLIPLKSVLNERTNQAAFIFVSLSDKIME
jgi:hypothetical protein